MRQSRVTKHQDISTPNIIFYIVLAGGAAALGYSASKTLAMDMFNINGEDLIFLGANPGGTITFGLCLQLLLDFSRTAAGRALDKKLSSLYCYVNSSFRQVDSAQVSAPLLELCDNPNPCVWDQSRLESCRTVLFRTFSYLKAIFLGSAVISVPVIFMFSGGDVFENPVKLICKINNVVFYGLQLQSFFSAARSDDRSGMVIYDEEKALANEEQPESELVSINRG